MERRQRARVRMLNLAWRDPDGVRHIFVDGAGDKALDLAAPEVGVAFSDHRLALLEDRSLPLVERTVHRMLKETFEQLREESDVDALTGLKNRRAFEREVNRLIWEQQGGGDQNALIIADVDQFNMINELCGVEGGGIICYPPLHQSLTTTSTARRWWREPVMMSLGY
ncbi:MAG: diguanylate cyclase [Candidatus Sedimenticola endophacoides]